VTKYIVRRFLISIPLMFMITVVTFTVVNLAPGDPVTSMIDPVMIAAMDIGQIEQMRRNLGLDKPIPVRYGLWVGRLVRGNLGYSYTSGRPVLEEIGRRIPPTLELTLAALVISTVLGVLFGVIAAIHQYSLYDYVLSFLSLFGLSIPVFFFALVALLLFVAHWELFPAYGMTSLTQGFSLRDNLYHLVLPASVLSIESMAGQTRYARTAMLEVLEADYVRTARAKGLSELRVVGRHAFRNALLPLITVTTLRLPGLIGGAIIIENIFAWPGMGRLSIDSIHERDYAVLMGLTFFIATLILAANLLADILYAYADPRIRITE
jgi:peptide/nickel transport system permease protein